MTKRVSSSSGMQVESLGTVRAVSRVPVEWERLYEAVEKLRPHIEAMVRADSPRAGQAQSHLKKIEDNSRKVEHHSVEMAILHESSLKELEALTKLVQSDGCHQGQKKGKESYEEKWGPCVKHAQAHYRDRRKENPTLRPGEAEVIEEIQKFIFDNWNELGPPPRPPSPVMIKGWLARIAPADAKKRGRPKKK